MPETEVVFSRRVLDTAIRLGLLFLLAAWCLQIVGPFIGILVWATILAVVTEPIFAWLKWALGGRGGIAAGLFVLLTLAVVLVPTVMLGSGVVDYARDLSARVAEGTLRVPPPAASVAGWPLIGEPLYEFWTEASENLEGTFRSIAPELAAFARGALSAVVGTGLGVLQFAVSLVLAGILLAKSEGAREVAGSLGERLAGQRGRELVDLAGATTQSVAKGVIGVAALQAALSAVGFVVMGIPGAGLWALLVLVLCTVQIGPLLVLLPIAIYVFSIAGTFTAILYLIWSVAITLLDNVLKPILLGRGVQVPTMVIFVGAIGGFLATGIIGLFVGAVVLSIAYELFMDWLQQDATA